MRSADKPLKLAAGLRVNCEAADRFTLSVDGASSSGGQHTLAILHAFRYPTSMREALLSLRATVVGAGDWMMLTSAIAALARDGILLPADADGAGAPTALLGSGFDGASIHAAMLNDRTRTDSYLQAIAETVKPGDTVIDLGTGTGILAMAAIRAGASKVYAIEATDVADAAQRLFEANGVTDRIELLRGHSTQVQLPQRADVLVSEIIGDDPLGEQVLESTGDALRRLLKPNARLLPRGLEVWATAVTAPPALLANRGFESASLDRWKRHYGFEFGPLAEFAAERRVLHYVSANSARRMSQLASAVKIQGFDLSDVQTRSRQLRFELQMCRSGAMDGLLLWFRMQLSENVWLETTPSEFRPDNHWRHPLYLCAKPKLVANSEVWDCSLDLSSAQPLVDAQRRCQ